MTDLDMSDEVKDIADTSGTYASDLNDAYNASAAVAGSM